MLMLCLSTVAVHTGKSTQSTGRALQLLRPPVRPHQGCYLLLKDPVVSRHSDQRTDTDGPGGVPQATQAQLWMTHENFACFTVKCSGASPVCMRHNSLPTLPPGTGG